MTVNITGVLEILFGELHDGNYITKKIIGEGRRRKRREGKGEEERKRLWEEAGRGGEWVGGGKEKTEETKKKGIL